MLTGDLEVVGDDRQSIDEVVEKGSPRLPTSSRRDLDADAELGDRDSRHRGLVVVGDHGIEIDAEMLGVDEGARVEQQQCQNRSSAIRLRRSSAASFAHDRVDPVPTKQSLQLGAGRHVDRLELGDHSATANDPIPLAAMLHAIEEVGEAPRGLRSAHVRHPIRLSDSRLAHGSSQRLATLVLAPLTSYGWPAP